MALINIIKWEANTNELVYKYPVDDLRLGSQLVVYPSQTAFFVKGGQILDEFICGTYTLKSENLPLLNKLINIPFGGDSPFQAEIWFVNRISMLDCKWGTASPIQIEDPKYNVIVPIRSYGQYGFKVGNPRLFLEKLIGNMPSFSTEKVVQYFRGVILSKLTALISQKLYADNLSIININSHVEDISAYAKEKLADAFAEYGVTLELFTAIAINVNEEDPSFQRLKEAKDSLARINIMGRENYQMERSFNVLDSAAENEGGGMIGTAVGIGAGVGIGTQIGGMVAQNLDTNPDNVPSLPSIQYYLVINGQRQGPFNYATVETKIVNGEVTENTLAWKKPMRQWAKIVTIEDFQHLFDENCPPPLPQI